MILSGDLVMLVMYSVTHKIGKHVLFWKWNLVQNGVCAEFFRGTYFILKSFATPSPENLMAPLL